MQALAAVAVAVSFSFACSSGSRATREAPDATIVSDAGTDLGDGDVDGSVDDASVDAAGRDVGTTLPLDACEVRVSNDHRAECRHACDARLLLVSGAHYCTFQCGDDSECAVHGLDCVEEMGGVCAPRCEHDADCPAGFFRCDPVGRFCDTYPVDA